MPLPIAADPVHMYVQLACHRLIWDKLVAESPPGRNEQVKLGHTPQGP